MDCFYIVLDSYASESLHFQHGGGGQLCYRQTLHHDIYFIMASTLKVTGETEETDLQRALRQRRPDYIAAAEERAGRFGSIEAVHTLNLLQVE